ncbi:unnamed protein product [Caenorhabditis auriculariae]|uniref:Uncharacterized protein n=1 Tax=Caenorhabditis auriculariae TaxID=2777116 RepID=A0A8S1HIS6_9PELO|nr:unnamed protein product [Caenorhabditis auriculariae]
MRYLFLLTFLVVPSSSAAERVKRQLSIDDLISGALSLVRPIFDTSKPIQNDFMLKKPDAPTQDDMRDTSILGSRGLTALDDLPLCKGNSGICRFISCSAENFKKDPTFGNIQLAAQVLGDAKLRKAISGNPETVAAVCKEQGMDDAQCKLFSKGFQFIDKFITTIEKPSDGSTKPENKPLVATTTPTVPEAPLMDEPMTKMTVGDSPSWSDYDMLPPASPAAPGSSNSKSLGSKTWSTNPETRPLQPLEIRNDLVSSWTPVPLFAPPTVPPTPPLAFKMVPSLIMPPIQLPSLENGIFFSTDKFPFSIKEDNSIRRLRRGADYYDQLETSSKASKKSSKMTETGDDYYGGLEQESAEDKNGEKSGVLKQCVHLLGLGV